MQLAARRVATLGRGLLRREFQNESRRRTLPTIDQIRIFDPADLEHARMDLTSALQMIGNAPSTDARRSELLRLLAVTHIRLGSPLDAEDCLREALDLEEAAKAMTGQYASGCSKAHREVRFLLGVVAQKLQNFAVAEGQLSAVVAEDDSHWRARFHLALVRLSAAEPSFDDCAALLERVLQDEPGHLSAQQILDKLHERKAAEQIKLDPLKEEA